MSGSAVPDSVRASLLHWYYQFGRDLPWRRTSDPYAIWVSEVMLQQTRVATVLDYYPRFLARFPTVEALAKATEDEVLAAWSGLGYYRRARFLAAGAREVVAKYGGVVPEGREARLSLPGVGRYTAGAIGSIAFGAAEPIVDGNVARVLSRLRAIDTPLGQAETERRLWDEAERLVYGPAPGALNQAMMELGATVCTPTSPRCADCPIAARCEARRQGRQAALPVAKPKRAPAELRLAAAVVIRRDEVLLVRGEEVLYGGLHSPPLVELSADAGPEEARRCLSEALRALGARGRIEAPRAEVTHVLTHRRLVVAVHRVTHASLVEGARGVFVPLERLGEVGVSRLTRKLLEAVALPS